jgi:hypothetical protein
MKIIIILFLLIIFNAYLEYKIEQQDKEDKKRKKK